MAYPAGGRQPVVRHAGVLEPRRRQPGRCDHAGRAASRTTDETARYLLDEYAIDYGILNPGSSLHLAVSVHPDYAAALIGAINDVMIEHWLPADPRYRTSIVVYANDPELAVREIHRLGDHPGVVQVLLPSASRTPYGQRILHPIYAAAQGYGLPVAIHPGAEGRGPVRATDGRGLSTTYLGGTPGWSAATSTTLVSMVTEGVFAKFPKLQVCAG
ncbi:MAG: amidohydrolase family protein [Caldilineaceae bacterium]